MSTNPLLINVSMPGRVFTLPSKGVFYKEGVLSANAQKMGEIEVKPMSGLAELKLKSADLLFTGRALQEICNECIPDIIRADQLTTKDIDALFIYLRMATYGNEFAIDYTHTCKNAKTHSYTISLETIVSNLHNAGLSDTKELLFAVKLSNGQEVKLKPMTFEDSLRIIHMRQEAGSTIKSLSNDEYVKIVQTITIEDTLAIIASVDGIENREQIREWIRMITKPQINQIIEQYTEAMKWGIDLEHKIKCKDCGEDFSYDMQLDPMSFFLG